MSLELKHKFHKECSLITRFDAIRQVVFISNSLNRLLNSVPTQSLNYCFPIFSKPEIIFHAEVIILDVGSEKIHFESGFC
jgi:hypothetical protein